ncbi:MAG: hypothetical protein MJE63_14760 [Proteobacteria bacterium]|nr:hypothetical protein [Pseudomonadota bacterium]
MKKLLTIFISLLTFQHLHADQGRDYSKSFEILGLRLGINTLFDVASKLGNSDRFHTGEAGTSEYKVCYKVSQGDETIYLEFGSHGEMAGVPNFILTSFSLRSGQETLSYHTRCSPLNGSKIKAMTKSGLRLGISRHELRAILGKPEKTTDNSSRYSKCIQKKVPENHALYSVLLKQEGCFPKGEKPYFDVCTTIIAEFKNSILTRISINRIESVC